MTPEERAALYEAAGGNPFLVQEAIASTRMSQDSEAQTHVACYCAWVSARHSSPHPHRPDLDCPDRAVVVDGQD